MKFTKTNNSVKITLNSKEWQDLGFRGGWLKKSNEDLVRVIRQDLLKRREMEKDPNKSNFIFSLLEMGIKKNCQRLLNEPNGKALLDSVLQEFKEPSKPPILN